MNYSISNQKQYGDTFNDLCDLLDDFSAENNYSINHEKLFKSSDENNKALHDKIIEFLNARFSSCQELNDFYTMILDSNLNLNQYKILLRYANEFPKSNLLVLDKEKEAGKTPFEFLEFDPNGNKYYYLRALGNKLSFQSIITPDGKCYLSPKNHELLISWLCANSINLHGSIRLIFTRDGAFEISSLAKYDYMLNEQEDMNIFLTQEQADCLASVYKNLVNIQPNTFPIKKTLSHSSNLGLEFGNGVQINTHDNLTRIINAFGEDINRAEYLSNIKNAQSFNQPLYFSDRY